MIPACPSHICFFDKGNGEGTNSPRFVLHICGFVFFHICALIDFFVSVWTEKRFTYFELIFKNACL